MHVKKHGRHAVRRLPGQLVFVYKPRVLKYSKKKYTIVDATPKKCKKIFPRVIIEIFGKISSEKGIFF